MNPARTLAKNQSRSRQDRGLVPVGHERRHRRLAAPRRACQEQDGSRRHAPIMVDASAPLPELGEVPGPTLGTMGKRIAHVGFLAGSGAELIAQEPGGGIQLTDGEALVPRRRVPNIERHAPGGGAFGAAADSGPPTEDPSEEAIYRHRANPPIQWPGTRGCGGPGGDARTERDQVPAAAIPTTGRLSGRPPIEPLNRASP
jgi:hypothetical protein